MAYEVGRDDLARVFAREFQESLGISWDFVTDRWLKIRVDLERATRNMREHAAEVGPQHAWWDEIFEFEQDLKDLQEQREAFSA
jgi:hypothetical protein